jgi:Rho-binding antiterminator
VSDEPYQPIPCVEHERLEFAVLKHQWLELRVMANGCEGRQRLLPRDVFTREQAEWLVAETETGATIKLRLDWLRF